MATRREKIVEKALEILDIQPDGFRYSELVKKISKTMPDVPVNTIHGTVWDLDVQQSTKIYKPSRGLFRLTRFKPDDCTKAIALGGNKFKDKWGTPDVVGKNESKRSDIIQSSIEIVSAEIKTDVNQLITAFGQTCSYRLFSHKAYLVIPKNSPQDDIARLDSLCMVFGIGLILFSPTDIENPGFGIRVRAIKHDPDMYYVNKYMKLIEKELFQ